MKFGGVRFVSLVAVLLATLVPGVAAAPMGPPTDGIIEVVGIGGSSAEFTLEGPAYLLAFENAFTRRPFFGSTPYVAGESRGDFVGWYLQRLPDEKPIAGFLTIPAMDKLFGRPLPLGLVPNWPETLEPGRYRVVLLGEGPSRAFIRTAEPWAARTLRATTPHPVSSTGALRWDPPVTSSAAPFEFADPTSLLLEFGWDRTDAPGADQSATCLTASGDETCAQSATIAPPGGGGGFTTGGPGTFSTSASLRFYAPGDVAPGAYNYVHHAVGHQSSGGSLLVGIADGGNPFAG